MHKTGKFVYNKKIIEEILNLDISEVGEEELDSKISILMDEHGASKDDIYPLSYMSADFEKDISKDVELLNKIKDKSA